MPPPYRVATSGHGISVYAEGSPSRSVYPFRPLVMPPGLFPANFSHRQTTLRFKARGVGVKLFVPGLLLFVSCSVWSLFVIADFFKRGFAIRERVFPAIQRLSHNWAKSLGPVPPAKTVPQKCWIFVSFFIYLLHMNRIALTFEVSERERLSAAKITLL